jgi:MFS family permease
MAMVEAGSATAEWRRHWPLVLACAVGMSLAALLSSVVGVMVEPLEQEFGWTRAQISSGPAVVSMMGLVLATPAGYLIDRWGVRLCGIITVAFSIASILAMSQVQTLWQWWAAWSLFGIPASFTSTVWLAPVSTIFKAARGMAIAITISGLGISMTLAPGIAEYFVEHHGWRSGYIALGVIWFVLTAPLILGFIPGRQAMAASVAAAHDTGPAETTFAGMTPREGFSSATFYLLFFASLFSAMTGVALVLNLVPVLTFTGLSRIDAVTIAGSTGIASITGRLIGGVLMDRYDVRRLAVGAALVSLAFPLSLLFFPGVFWAAFIGTMAYGLTGGMKMNAIVYLVSTHLGARSFGLFYGAISITTTVAQGIGPLAANHIYDVTRSYTPVMWAAIPGFLIAAVLFAALRPAPRLSRQPAPA